jgi:acyl transferase domain-containing protein/acyl carrier protein/SAM-dependent methyltransferase
LRSISDKQIDSEKIGDGGFCMREMEELLSRLLWQQLRTMGEFAEAGSITSASMAAAGIDGKYERWFEHTLAVLTEHGWLRMKDTAYFANDRSTGLETAWSEWNNRKQAWLEDSSLRARVTLLDAVLHRLPDILTGKLPATDVLFPNSSMQLVEGIYKDNEIADYFNEGMANAVVAYIEASLKQNPHARFRLLEIGAGTGGTSAMVIRKLTPYQDRIAEYKYTDISQGFLRHAEAVFGTKAPYLTCQLYHVEKPCAEQQIQTGVYDLVLASNVLHATANIRSTLRNAKTLLKKNGLLLINEISGNSLFAHLTFGLLQGWWLYEDHMLRIPGCPGLYPETWRRVLSQEGFQHVLFPVKEAHALGQQIIIAQSDGIVRQARIREADDALMEAAATGSASITVKKTEKDSVSVHEAMDEGQVKRRIRSILMENLSVSLKLDKQRIDTDESFSDYGLDSITGVQFVKQINNVLGTALSTTILFDYSSIRKLTDYLWSAFGPVITAQWAETDGNVPSVSSDKEAGQRKPSVQQEKKTVSSDGTDQLGEVFYKEPIAIIGMSGKFAKSDTLEELWKHLENGDDLVEKVTRWDLSSYMENDSFCNFGSFIEGVDLFDPLFFNTSPTEAAYMDPQQRLFLEEAWKALEHAGYAGKGMDGRACGIYAGFNMNYYAELIEGRPPAQAMWGNAGSVIPARLSYYLNLQGPAVTVDTACSSSLVAIHLACQSLWSRETEAAIAGGVFLQPTPGFYISATRAGMLSADGRCYTFDDRANGFVPGEGVGVVVLKRLQDALKDGDSIYGVIRGSATNQDGTTNGITAPSARSQEMLLRQVYDSFGLNPADIQLVEAHGTGTRLGDPIEYQALSRAFRQHTSKTGYCALGSIKTNIGHTTAAAGIAGLLKILLAMKHRKLPPSLHFQSINGNIEASDSPFYINTSLKNWEVEAGGKRRAAISAFGFSGTNAHMVIEEAPDMAPPRTHKPAYLIALSARTVGQLRRQAEQMMAYVKGEPNVDLGHVSFTLLLGRKHFPHRLACIVQDAGQLAERLAAWLENGQAVDLFQSDPGAQLPLEELPSDHYGYACMDACARETERMNYLERIASILELYTQGYEMSFDRLFADGRYIRLALPVYPFARERYWVPESTARPAVRTKPPEGAVLHPLLHRKIPAVEGTGFRSTFTGHEFFLADHVIMGRSLLPGVAFLEMARAAVGMAFGSSGGDYEIRLKDLFWTRPYSVDGPHTELEIHMETGDNGTIDYGIYATAADQDEAVRCHQGKAAVVPFSRAENVTLDAIRQKCSLAMLDAQQCYTAFRQIGMHYGPTFQCIERLYIGEEQSLAKLRLPAAAWETASHYGLHPGMLDAALQAAGVVATADLADRSSVLDRIKSVIPFALKELRVYKSCTSDMWAHIRRSANPPFDEGTRQTDIDLCDEQGNVCARLIGLAFREPKLEDVAAEQGNETLLWEPVWVEKEAVREDDSETTSRHIVFLCEPNESIVNFVQSEAGSITRYVTLSAGRAAEITERYETYAVQMMEELKSIHSEGVHGETLIQIASFSSESDWLFRGLTGLLRTACLEYSGFIGQYIELEQNVRAEDLIRKLLENRSCPEDFMIRYRKGVRQVQHWVEREEIPSAADIPWKHEGVYFITGGAGGLGYALAQEIAGKVASPTLVLAGRTPASTAIHEKLAALGSLGAQAVYMQMDVSDKEQTVAVIQAVRSKYGRLNGIIHAAGLLRDSLLVHKTKTQVAEVMGAKVKGVVHLDDATRELEVDWVLVFSAAAAVLGNYGQADYAAANGFMDAYATYRNGQSSAGGRKGRILSINWPLWQDGGMRVTRETEQSLKDRIGMAPMKAMNGMQALYRAFGTDRDQLLFMHGDPERLRAYIRLVNRPARPKKPKAHHHGAVLQDELTVWVKQQLAGIIGISAEDIHTDTAFDKYGMDSIMQLDLIRELEKLTGELPKTLLFEHNTVREAAAYLADHYAEQIRKSWPADVMEQPPAPHISVTSSSGPVSVREAFDTQQQDVNSSAFKQDGIAIIGVAGRYPKANQLEELWERLRSGENCITEAPADRWCQTLLRGSSVKEIEQKAPYYGGFLDAVDRFDHQLFEMDAEEARDLPPEARLFLETVWETFESAGYSKAAIQHWQNREQAGIGVFAGTMYSQYGWQMPSLEQAALHSNRTDWQIANRTSHFFNLTGPSLTVNTACSSSLTAIHLACESLRQNGCSMAVAGGVNLTLDVSKYEALEQVNFLATGGKSKSFGDGDGYIPGEGVGAVLLKPLALAERDGDRILGIITYSGVNHGGGRQKYSVPDPKQQAQLMESAIKRSGVDPESITYVECAANGSPLGDSIEVAALRSAFSRFTGKQQYCAIGSVKSNIGHLEAASGISQLSKVLLQLKYRMLVPSIHADVRNPNLKLEGTPFYLQEKFEPWEQKVDPSNGNLLPRRSMINSFGAGGSYAVLIVEEYIGPHIRTETGADAAIDPPSEYLAVWSAKTEYSLRSYTDRMLRLLRKERNLPAEALSDSLIRINHDLEYRLAIIYRSVDDLRLKLEALRAGEEVRDPDMFISPNCRLGKSVHAVNTKRQDHAGELYRIALQWVQGGSVDLESLMHHPAAGTVNLPHYAFDYGTDDGEASVHGSGETQLRVILERVSRGEMSKSEAMQYFFDIEV